MAARLEHDIREQHRLAGLGPDPAWKRQAHFYVQIVADALAELERAVVTPDFPSLPGHAAIGIDFFLRHRNYESVDIMSHGFESLRG